MNWYSVFSSCIIGFSLLFICRSEAQEIDWTPIGIGGGGALFSPSIHPDQADELYISSDLGAVFHSDDFGLNWEVVSHRELTAAPLTEVQFSGSRRYALKHEGFYYRPVYSADGGETWNALSSDPTNQSGWFLFADPDDSNRILLSSYDELFYSDDGGQTFHSVYSTNDLYIGGVFWNGSEIFVGCRTGLLVSEDGGATFALEPPSGDLPGDYGFLSFCGGSDGTSTRLYAVARNDSSMWPGMQGSEYWGEQEIFVMNWNGNKIWNSMNSGIDSSDFPFFIDMTPNQVDTVYSAGTLQGWGYPMVWKSTDGALQWNEEFEPFGNANVYTGWQGEGGDQNWWWGGSPMGFDVSGQTSERVVFTDFGFVHLTTDGGQTWRQAYVDTMDQNPPGDTDNEGQYYHSNGLEPTSCWWLYGLGDQKQFAGFSDITGIRSIDTGSSWSFDYTGNDYNSTYQIISSSDDSVLFAATSSAHDIYESVYLTDDLLDDATGEILYSTDTGASWNSLYDGGEPVVWLSLDPNDPNRMYASLVDSENGGIYSTDELDQGANANWYPLNDPPRTEGHPFNIHVLNDGTLVTSWSARRENGQFTQSSGIFISNDQGNSWDDRSIPEMERWTKDIVIDPTDTTQNTWYACVFSHWGDPPNEVGGLYRTKDRGQSWTEIGDFYRVESCTVHPKDSNKLFVTTEADGLWYTDDALAVDPDFDSVTSYTFKHPLRLFFHPEESEFMYLTSFGNGIRMGSVLDTTDPIARCRNDTLYLDQNGEAVADVNSIDDGSSDNYIVDSMFLSTMEFDCQALGDQEVTLTVIDELGNSSSCTSTILISDSLRPQSICVDDTVTVQAGLVDTLNIAEVNGGSYDNCGLDSLSLSQNTFQCSDSGDHSITLTVWDTRGNSDECISTVTVNCELVQLELSGTIKTAVDSAVRDVTVSTTGNSASSGTTDADGDYSVQVDSSASITLEPEKDTMPTEGVSTLDLVTIQLHILDLVPLNSPEQLIAADASNNGVISTLDIVLLQALLLNFIDDFPNNTSWRFVRSDYEFPDPLNPWVETWPEDTTLSNVTMDIPNLDFTGIKIGDVNGSYSPQNSTYHPDQTTRLNGYGFNRTSQLIRRDGLADRFVPVWFRDDHSWRIVPGRASLRIFD